MARASTRPDGVTAPVESGFSSHERMNRNLVVQAKSVLLFEQTDLLPDRAFELLQRL